MYVKLFHVWYIITSGKKRGPLAALFLLGHFSFSTRDAKIKGDMAQPKAAPFLCQDNPIQMRNGKLLK
jgi:hypothetical protein